MSPNASKIMGCYSSSASRFRHLYQRHLLPYKGLSFAAFGSFLLAINACLVKKLTTMHAPAIALSREAILFCFTVSIFLWSGRDFLSPKGTRIQLLLRSVFGSTAFLLYFFALKWMPIADVSVIAASTPVVVTLFARLFLKKDEEAGDIVHWLCMGLSLLGLLVLSRLPEAVFSSGSLTERVENLYYWYGFSAALVSTVLGAAVIVFLRQLRRVPIIVVQVNHTCIALVELVTVNLALSPWIPPSYPRCGWMDGPSLITIGFLTFFAQFSLSASLKTEQAGPVSLVRFAGRVFFVFILQVMFLDEVPDVHSISAAILVLASLVLSTYRRYRLQSAKRLSDKKIERDKTGKDLEVVMEDVAVRV